MEKAAIDGDSPVSDPDRSPLICALQSNVGLVESGVKLPGPPGKAKYYSMTDSELVGRLNDEKHSES